MTGARRALLAAALALHLASPAGAQEASAPAPAPAPQDVPAGPARVVGQVLHAETGRPVPGVDVVLYALSRDGVPGMRRTVSDEAGHFAFEGVASVAGHAYLLGARHEGVPHPGDRVVFAEGSQEARVEIRVTDVTDDPARVKVPEAVLRLVWDGARLRVFETLRLANEGRLTYYAPPDRREGARPALETALPEQAGDLSMPLGVMPEGLAQDGRRLRYFGPVHPGSGELAWSYTVPVEGESSALAATLPAGTERVSVWVPEDGPEVHAPGLQAAPETRELEGRRFRVLEGPAPAAGEPLRLALRFPPARIDTEAFAAVEARLVLHLDDAAMDVTETHIFRVEGAERVLAPAGEPLARILLPEGARGLRFGTNSPSLTLAPAPAATAGPDAGGVAGDGLAGALAVGGMATPGESVVELAYRLPVAGSPVALERTFAQRLPLLSVYLADTGRLAPESERLHRRRPTRTQDLTYLHLEAFEVAAGETVGLRVGTLPARAPLPRPVILGLVGATAALAIAYLVAPLRRSQVAPAEESAALAAARRERDALYAAIADLDDDFETGKISDEDHRALRDDLRLRAVALMRVERAAGARGEPAPEPRGRVAAGSSSAAPVVTPTAGTGTGTPGCPACSAPVGSADRFCAQCGAPLSPRSRRGAGADRGAGREAGG